MVGHHMSLKYFYAFIFAQSPDYLLQICGLYMIFLLYFGTNTMWYLQTHLVWDKLFVWFAILSPFVLQ